VEEATPAPGVADALREADRIIIGPSNPAISIEPILAVAGRLIDPARTMAVTPIVAGAALKGPTLEMLRDLGREATPTGVASGYRQYATTDALGYRVVLLDTVMAGQQGRRRLASELLLL
jgi:LPPG:FO 2-phospho-L-lactate transferase